MEDRPAEVAQRQEFGHYEIDCVVSCVGGKGGILTIVERKTRNVFAVKLLAITQDEVIRALRYLIRSGQLKNVRSITTDNGSEFLDAHCITRLLRQYFSTADLYYTHAYSAWEKGSVENANRLLRRRFPKGTDFSKLTRRQIQTGIDFINSISRRISLNGLSASEAYTAA